MKKSTLIILLFATLNACTKPKENQTDILQLTVDVNECLSSKKESCCDVINKLNNEVVKYDSLSDNTIVCTK